MIQASATLPEKSVLPIPRREALAYEEFVQDYLYPLQPVIIKNGFHWNAFGKWNPEFFKKEFGSRLVPVRDQRITVAEFVDRVVEATDENPAPYLVGTGTGNYCLDLFPELAADIDPVPEYLLPNWLTERYLMPLIARRLNRGPRAEIFFGGKGAGFAYIHWDSLHFHAFNTQVYGEKHWYLYAPDQEEFLYPSQPGGNKSLINDPSNPDLERFPLFENATCYQSTLGPGEMLFIPAGWWHTTRITEPSISIAMNSANGSNWPLLKSDLVEEAAARFSAFGPLASMYLKVVELQRIRRDRKRIPILNECGTTTV